MIEIQGGNTQQVLYVNPYDQGLRYAAVFLHTAPASPPPTDAVTIVQQSFVFLPPVLAVHSGQAVRFTNNDNANHTVRATDAEPANFNELTAYGAAHLKRFTATTLDRPVVLGCDLHPWMAGWIYVLDHPYFAITDKNGRFRVSDIPPGRYELGIRQPGAGLGRDVSVVVGAGTTVTIDVPFDTADLHLSSIR